MIDFLPPWINYLFIASVVYAIIFFHFNNRKSTKTTILIIVWSIIQSILAKSGFYLNTNVMPPRFLLVLIPVSAFILFGIFSQRNSNAQKNKLQEYQVLIHAVRLPIEIVLYYLFIYKMLPELMTFRGRNFDILAGFTAPIIAYLLFKKKLSTSTMIVWNSLGLLLVLFVFVNGILSSELPIQIFGFEQPNRAMSYFPFILLPATVVPIIIYTHIKDILWWLSYDKKS